jgi:hypothetical protein
MKLTPFSRLIIVLLVLVGAFLLIRNFVPQLQQSTNENPQLVEVEEDQAEEAVKKEERKGGNAVFDYATPKPINGTLKGVVELGASGFNSFIINVDKQDRWELKKAEFGASLVYENMATEQDVRDGLKKYIATMLDYGVSGKEIHFMVSSSAIKTPEVQKIRQGLKSLGYVVNTVTAEQEGRYALMASLPDDWKDSAFAVDIGSGNTKVSWISNGQIESEETYGSKYYQDGVSDEQVYNAVRAVASKVPPSKRKMCFIIGGAPFSMAKDIRNGKERYTVLLDPEDYDSEEQKFQAGVNIYKALKDETDADPFVFDWDANFTIGFLLSL